jgi:hypothetical protein
MVPHNGTLAGSTTPKGTATIATDRNIGEGLHPTQHHASHMFLTKHLLASASPPPEEARHSLKHGATCEHQPAPQPHLQGRPTSAWRSASRLQCPLPTCYPQPAIAGHGQHGPPQPQQWPADRLPTKAEPRHSHDQGQPHTTTAKAATATATEGSPDCRAYTPGTQARKGEDRLLLEFPCNSTRTRSV